PEIIGAGPWIEVQERLARLLAAVLGLPPRECAPQRKLTHGSAMALAGLISVADWIGSNTHPFPPSGPAGPSPAPLDLIMYAKGAAQHAEEALADVAWDHVDLTGQLRTFQQLFPNKPPRPVQSAVVTLAQQLTAPGLVIVESPTAEGKTEAA